MSQANSTQLANRSQPPIMALLQQPGVKKQIEAALPRHVTPDRMLRMALTCIRKTPKLAECEPLTVLAAIVELAQLGLEPATPLGHAWILPYGRSANVIIGYKGFISLADRSGVTMTAEVVYDKDKFHYEYGTSPQLKHTPCEDLDRGELRYAYAVAFLRDRQPTFRVLNRADIQQAKEASPSWQLGQRNTAKRDSPWYTDEAAMWRKTAIRRLSSFLPLSAEYARAVELDTQADRLEAQVFDLTPPQTRNELDADKLERQLSDTQAHESLPEPAAVPAE